MSKDDKDDKHKRLKEYAKEHAQIAGIAGIGAVSAKPIVHKAIQHISVPVNRDPASIKKWYDKYNAEQVGKNTHILTDPENGNKVLAIYAKRGDNKYYMDEMSASKVTTKQAPRELVNQLFSTTQHPNWKNEGNELLQELKESKILDKLNKDPKYSGAIMHSGDVGLGLHEMTHASRSGFHKNFQSNVHLPGSPTLSPAAANLAYLPVGVYVAGSKKKADESEKEYQRRMGRNIGIGTLGAAALAAPSQVVEEGRANLGAMRRAKALGLPINKKGLAQSWLGYVAMTAGKPLAAGASTYAAMKLLRRNKLKDEERKNMEKKSELTDDKIIAATESAKREAKDVMLAASLAGAVAPMIAHQVAKRHGTDLYHLSENKQAAKKAIRGVQAVMLAPLVLRKKGIKQYYLEKLEEQKRENKKK